MGDRLRRWQYPFVAVALVASVILVLRFGDAMSLATWRGVFSAGFMALSIAAGVIAGPVFGMGVALLLGAAQLSFVVPFSTLTSIAAGVVTVALWCFASALAAVIVDRYRRGLRHRQQEVEERQRLAAALNDIGSVIASSVDKSAILRKVVALTGQALAAESTAVCEYDGRHWHVEYAWGAVSFLVGRSFVREPEGVTGQLERTRAPVLVCNEGGHGVRSQTLAALGIIDSLVVPFVTDGAVTGALFVNAHSAHRIWDGAEIDFTRTVGSDVSAALETVRLYQDQLRIATKLQEQFIRPLPVVEGLELAAVSETARDLELVGGDIHDVFELPSGEVAMLIADVQGKGVAAAGLTETVRSAVRTLAMVSPSPRYVLSNANRLLVHQGQDQFVTALFVVLDPVAGAAVMGSAGHPPPVRISHDYAELVRIPAGTPLGTFEGDFPMVGITLKPGDALVMYTDGLTEARRGRELWGERRLLQTVTDLSRASVSELAEGLRDRIEGFATALRDDVQIVVVRLAERASGEQLEPEPIARLQLPVSCAAWRLSELRGSVRDFLEANELDRDTVEDLVVCIEEACANSIRHSGSESPGRLCLEVHRNAVEVEVRDHGKGYDETVFERRGRPDVLSTGGRGLYLIEELSDGVELWNDAGACLRLRKERRGRAT